MTLPYSRATSGRNALSDLQKILQGFGCTRFGTMTDTERGELLVQFSHRGRDVIARASYKGYAAALLRSKRTTTATERAALKQAEISVCSVLRDWIKGQVVAIESGVLTFEDAFLGQILLSNGQTILDHVEQQKLLPAPKTEA